MNNTLKNFAKKILLIPKVKQICEKTYQSYTRFRFQERLDTFEGEFEFYTVLRSEQLAPQMGGFNKSDVQALDKLVQIVLREKVMIAEIGSWTGISTIVLGKIAKNFAGNVFAIDHWMGSEGVLHHKQAKTEDIYAVFKRNIQIAGIWDVIKPLVMDSYTASQIFADGILDLVFIDADHRYQNIKEDIALWLPKLRNGGILCGHDCEGYYSQYTEIDKKKVDEHLEVDCIPTTEDYTPAVDDYTHNLCHPGVVKALYEYFQDKYLITPNSTIWYYIKQQK